MTPPPTGSGPIPWWQAEPSRLERDRAEIAVACPDLDFEKEGEGSWTGVLPRWPFDRPEPLGLADLVGETGLRIELKYVPAYPMVLPVLWPRDPVPELIERTQQSWHVLPIGALCLLQSEADWDPRNSVVDLLLKAAGWRVEYALMKAGVIERMSTNGIVNDGTHDHLVPHAAGRGNGAGQPG